MFISISNGKVLGEWPKNFRVTKSSLGEMDILLNHLTLCYKHNFLIPFLCPKSLVRIWVLSVGLPSMERMSDLPDFEYIRF